MTRHAPAILVAAGLTLCSPLLADNVESTAKRVAFPDQVRGVTISTHGIGRDWGTAELMRPVMTEIQRVGGDWIAIHPYARISADGSVGFSSLHSDEAPGYITRPIALAKAQGLKILIKPHLAYWGSPFSWRGEITFDTEAKWERFWTDYEQWIVQIAELASDADGFVIGTELDQTLTPEKNEQRWRNIIKRVRSKTPAPLTYAANWTDYQRVGFWDALDAIGIQAYFPVADRERPDKAAVRSGWKAVMATLSDFSKKHQRPILFTELGYNHSFAAALRPWEAKVDGDAAVGLQETCLQIALKAVEQEPTVLGSFLWKWFPEPRPVGRNFRLATPGIKRVIRRSWVGNNDEAVRSTPQ